MLRKFGIIAVLSLLALALVAVPARLAAKRVRKQDQNTTKTAYSPRTGREESTKEFFNRLLPSPKVGE